MEWPLYYEKILVLEDQDWTQAEIADHISDLAGEPITRHMVRHALDRAHAMQRTVQRENDKTEVKSDETIEILEGGSYRSTKLIEMSSDQCKDPGFLLTAHGFDGSSWELLTAKNNIWNSYSEENGVQTFYSSKITARPLKNQFNIDDIVRKLLTIESVTVEQPKTASTGMLEVPLYDMHLGLSDLEYYNDKMERICAIISERQREEIVFAIGSDMFHNDNFRNQTSNGTLIEGMDFASSWVDAATLYYTLIECALQSSNRVKVIYVKGNHCESMSWAFCKMLEARYPQVVFDIEIEERKMHYYGEVAVGFTHGDKATKDLDRAFMAEYPKFACATVREIHMGHNHHETSKDHFGIVVRSLSTSNKTDKWHKDKGYVGNNKRFMLFEYTTDFLSDIRYV